MVKVYTLMIIATFNMMESGKMGKKYTTIVYI